MSDAIFQCKVLTDDDVKLALLQEGYVEEEEPYDGLFHMNHDVYTHMYHSSMLMKIENLDLSNNKIFCAKGLEFCNNLVTLNLKNNRLESMTHLQDLKHLKYLNLQNNNIHAVGYLGNSPGLEFLNLADNEIGCNSTGRSTLYNLMHNHQLKVLDLRNNCITEEVLGDFVQFPGLQELYFSPNPIVSSYPNYRTTFVFFLTQVKILDGEPITEDEYNLAVIHVWRGPRAAERERRRLERRRRGEPEESLLSTALHIAATPFRIIPMLLNPLKLVRWICNLFRQ